MSYRIFISHKNDDDSNEYGTDLGAFLREKEHTIFFDKDYLKGGMLWQEEIINKLLISDVVIVILNEGTAESDWVQREIDMARALNISILPLPVVKDISTIQDALDRFDLNATQYIKLAGVGRRVEPTYEKIEARLKPLSEKTQTKQRSMITQLQERRNPPVKITPKIPFSDSTSNFRVFTHANAPNIEFMIATGDACSMSGYDVLVNTENDYMQMARFYQINTLSYGVRRKGAYMRGESLIEDTIQNELYDSASNEGLPVHARTVLATSAGHKRSRMKSNTDYHYILHAAAVRFVTDGSSQPNQPVGNIPQLIENCFEVIHEIDEASGEVKGKKNIIVPADENYQPLTSILFPAFGAGEGGKAYDRATEDIISSLATKAPVCIRNFGLSINKIGFSVYFKDDVKTIENIFLSHGFEKV